MVDVLMRCAVICFKCHLNPLSGYGAVGGRKWPFLITLASGLYNSLYLPYIINVICLLSRQRQLSLSR